MFRHWYVKGFPPMVGEAKHLYRHGKTIEPRSLIYVCRKCGEVWASGIIISDDPYYEPLGSFCPQHNGGFTNVWHKQLAMTGELLPAPLEAERLLEELNFLQNSKRLPDGIRL